MMFHWTVIVCSGWFFLIIGYQIGRRFRQEEVTTKVTSTIDEIEQHDWPALCEPHICRFEVGATFGSGVTFNKEGSKAMAQLLTEMSNRLDYTRHHLKKMRESA